ncbi:hypothetical protein CANCADRAFT_32335 [Tortispora caseinolytica NRRL Y-17796]|uniref:C2H2-type domain-containing protein n=1 Tax=Tortispora caseinolytica NRRL Y-17796 TaxID=767744 RepID=A0A1E4TAV2_9ASCO|nr:hypothetical protein CANCADRAFT_32335 [Tortispora caseinolytica NRRL Y-17796]
MNNSKSTSPEGQHKRHRRRHGEIERLYACNYQDCQKAYGTLNHLNAHVQMQGHGAKRLPEEFKEIRDLCRLRRKQQQKQGKLLQTHHHFRNQNQPLDISVPRSFQSPVLSGSAVGTQLPSINSVHSGIDNRDINSAAASHYYHTAGYSYDFDSVARPPLGYPVGYSLGSAGYELASSYYTTPTMGVSVHNSYSGLYNSEQEPVPYDTPGHTTFSSASSSTGLSSNNSIYASRAAFSIQEQEFQAQRKSYPTALSHANVDGSLSYETSSLNPLATAATQATSTSTSSAPATAAATTSNIASSSYYGSSDFDYIEPSEPVSGIYGESVVTKTDSSSMRVAGVSSVRLGDSYLPGASHDSFNGATA